MRKKSRSRIALAQITEVQRRISQVERGEVRLIPGDEALARVRALLAKRVRCRK